MELNVSRDIKCTCLWSCFFGRRLNCRHLALEGKFLYKNEYYSIGVIEYPKNSCIICVYKEDLK